jgi:hypothetical protein
MENPLCRSKSYFSGRNLVKFHPQKTIGATPLQIMLNITESTQYLLQKTNRNRYLYHSDIQVDNLSNTNICLIGKFCGVFYTIMTLAYHKSYTLPNSGLYLICLSISLQQVFDQVVWYLRHGTWYVPNFRLDMDYGYMGVVPCMDEQAISILTQKNSRS